MINITPNCLYTGDNLPILHGINSECVDLIYLDPPFNSKRMYKAPVGSKAAGAHFDDMWTWDDVDKSYLEGIIDQYPFMIQFIGATTDIYGKAMASYITYMAQRLIEMHRILKPTGSMYLHCDQTASHYLKILCDRIFGKSNFRDEIVWKRVISDQKGSQYKAKTWGTNTDSIFMYAKSAENTVEPFKKTSEEEKKKKFPIFDEERKDRYNTATPIFRNKGLGARPNLCYEWKKEGKTFKNPHPSGWRLKKDRLEEEYIKGNVVIKTVTGKSGLPEKRLERRAYLKDYKGVPVGNLWNDIEPVRGYEDTGYPTQKPLKLLHRIIESSSRDADIVLDPFCGCATAMVAAQQRGRKWIGIDLSEESAKLVADRLSDENEFTDFAPIVIGKKGFNLPRRTDIEKISQDRRDVKKRLYKEQDKKCNGCFVNFEERNLEVDHILPKSKGGGDFYENYQLLCGHCNRVKGDKPMEYLLNKIQQRNKIMPYKEIFD